MRSSDAELEFLERIQGIDSGQGDVPEAYVRKPDPDEPWRYVCPDCGGQVQADGLQYDCTTCRGMWDRNDLRDLKRDQ